MNTKDLLLLLYILFLNKPHDNQVTFHIVDSQNNNLNDTKILMRPYYCKNCILNESNNYGIAYFNTLTETVYEVIIYKEGYNISNFLIQVSGYRYYTICLEALKKNRLYGYIKDINNKPIDRALVVLYNVLGINNYNPIKFTYTLSNGEYNFIDIPQGCYLVKATKSW